MYKVKSSSRLTKLKGFGVILGALLLGIGLFSHFESTWVKRIHIPQLGIDMRVYEICDIPGAEKCPDIVMERFFVGVIIATLIVFTILLFINLESPNQQSMEKGYYILGAVLLVIGGILYAISTQQIYDIFEGDRGDDINFRRWEKFAAAALSFVQAMIYCSIFKSVGKY